MYLRSRPAVPVLSRCAKRLYHDHDPAATAPPNPDARSRPEWKATPLKTKTLGKDSTVIVLPDSELRRPKRPKRSRPAQHAGPRLTFLRRGPVLAKDVPRVLEDMQRQSSVPGQAEVNDAIEQQRPPNSRALGLEDEDRCIVPLHVYRSYRDSLMEQFNQTQLKLYCTAMEAKKLEALSKNLKSLTQAPPTLLVRGPWRSLRDPADKPKVSVKQAVTESLLNSIWKLDVREQIEEGYQLLRASRMDLKVLGVPPRHRESSARPPASSVPGIAERHHVRILIQDVDITIYGSKHSCRRAAEALEDAAHQVYSIPLEPYLKSSQADGPPSLGETSVARKDFRRQFAKTYGCLYVGNSETFVGPTKEDALICFRAFLLRLIHSHQQAPTAVLDGLAAKVAESPSECAVQPMALATTRSELQNKLLDRTFPLGEEAIDSIVAALETTDIGKDKKKRGNKDQETRQADHTGLPWSPKPVTNHTATLCRGSGSFQPTSLGLSQLLAHDLSLAEAAPAAATTPVIDNLVSVDFIPLPKTGKAELSVSMASQLPGLNLSFKMDKQRKELLLSSAQLRTQKRILVDIPRLALGLNLSRDHIYSLENPTQDSKSIASFAQQLATSIFGLGRVQLPENVEIDLPKEYADLVAHNSQDITYIPTGLEVAQVLALDFGSDARLVIRSTLAGQNTPSRETVSVVTAPDASADANQQSRSLIKAANSLLEKLHKVLYRSKLERSPAAVQMVDDSIEDASNDPWSMDYQPLQQGTGEESSVFLTGEQGEEEGSGLGLDAEDLEHNDQIETEASTSAEPDVVQAAEASDENDGSGMFKEEEEAPPPADSSPELEQDKKHAASF